MIFSSNIDNEYKDKILEAAKRSGCYIEIRLPTNELLKDTHFSLWRKEFDISKFWREYEKLE